MSLLPGVESFDPRWQKVNTDGIRRSFDLFDSDPNVQTAYKIRTQSLLNGNILFKRRGGLHLPRDAKDWYSATYADLCRYMIRSEWCIGFIAITSIPHPKYSARPLVLPLENGDIDVYHYRDHLGVSEFKYYRHLQPHEITNSSGFHVEIPNVETFVIKPPDSHGSVSSIMTLLMPDIAMEAALQELMLIAERHRANPPLVSEPVNTPYNPNALTSAMAPPLSSSVDKPTDIMERLNDSASRMQNELLRKINSMHEGQKSGLVQFLSNGGLEARALTNQLLIPEGRKYVNHHLAEPPAIVLQFRAARQERTLNLLGVPVSMISNSSSTTRTASNASTSSNAQTVFNNAQKELKLRLITWMKMIYQMIYRAHHYKDYVRKLKGPEEFKRNDALEAMDIDIEMTSLPEEAIMLDYYRMGVLKYDALVRYAMEKHALTEDSFNPSPGLTLQEVNGIKLDSDEMAS